MHPSRRIIIGSSALQRAMGRQWGCKLLILFHLSVIFRSCVSRAMFRPAEMAQLPKIRIAVSSNYDPFSIQRRECEDGRGDTSIKLVDLVSDNSFSFSICLFVFSCCCCCCSCQDGRENNSINWQILSFSFLIFMFI